ncbi:MAG: glycosyltransferase [Planctomycetes bacterium]|nr:glycosyltransferase [Planctomycetota bacterium]
MRIVCLNQDAGIGPGRKKGAAVHLAAMRDAFVVQGAEVVPLDESDEKRVEAALTAARARGVDLVYERYALGKSAAARFTRAQGIPLVLEVNAPLAEEEARYRAGAADVSASDRELFSSAELVIAVSSDVARYAIERGALPERVHVRPNGVDTRRFRPRVEGDAVRAKLVPAGRFALGFHGRLRPWHGFELFARAAERMLAAGEDIHLVLVGEGEFEPHLARRVPAERVTRIAWVEHAEIGPYVASFDALPLTYDPSAPCYFSPLKLAEAMACGVVPVLPALGDLVSAATDEVDALFYPAGDLETLVAKLRGLIADPARRTRLSRGAIANAQKKSWNEIAAFVLDSTSAHGRRAER